MQSTPSYQPIFNFSFLMKFYFGFCSYFFMPCSQGLRGGGGLCAVLHRTLISGDIAPSGDAVPSYAVSGLQPVLLPGDAAPSYAVSGLQPVLLPGDAAPSYAVSGLQPEMPDYITISCTHNKLSGHRPGTSDIGAAPLLYSRTNT